MKCAEYYIDNHKIEVYNSIFGKEKIFVNGHMISERKSVFGKPHDFTIGNNSYSIIPKLSVTSAQGRSFEVHRNGQAITLVNFTSENSKALLILAIILGLGLGYLIGLMIYQSFFEITI